MNKPCLLAYIEDASLQLFIQGIAESKHLDFYCATQGQHLAQCVKTYSPFMMIVDMTGFSTEWLFKHIAEIKHHKPAFPIVAFLRFREDGAIRRLESVGCRMIFIKSEVREKIADTIEDTLRSGA